MLMSDITRVRSAVAWFASQGLNTIRVHYPKILPTDRPLGACSCGSAYKLDADTGKPVDAPGLCSAPGKHPVDKDWNHGRVTTSEDWSQPWNVGLMCGPEHGLMVLDVDVRNGGLETMSKLGPLVWAESAGWDVNDTFSYFTSGHNGSRGYHLLFKIPGQHDEWARLQAAKPIKGVDLKISGMVVAVPSLHASGDEYHFRRAETPIKTLTETEVQRLVWALDELAEPASSSVLATAPGEATDLLRAWALGMDVGYFGEGERNNGMLPLVGALVKLLVDGWSGSSDRRVLEMMLRDLNQMAAADAPEGVMRLVNQVSQSMCRPPLGPEELGTMTHNILRAELEKQLGALAGVSGMVRSREARSTMTADDTRARMSKLFGGSRR